MLKFVALILLYMRSFEKIVGSRFKGTFVPLLMLEIEKKIMENLT
jgi:hypothetical protein